MQRFSVVRDKEDWSVTTVYRRWFDSASHIDRLGRVAAPFEPRVAAFMHRSVVLTDVSPVHSVQ